MLQMVLQNKCYCNDVIFWSFVFILLSALDSAVLSFLLLSESLAILSNRYSLTVFQPPGDLSAILTIFISGFQISNRLFNSFQ